MAALHEPLRGGGPAREAQGPMACDDGTQWRPATAPKFNLDFQAPEGQDDARHGGVPRFVFPIAHS